MATQPRIRRSIRLTMAVILASVRFIGAAIGFIAASTQTAPADDELSSSIRGGTLNHRTGKFDDGTDPAGIYELD